MDAAFRGTISKRYALLRALSTEPKTKPELVESLDCSRSTVDRAIKELRDAACIEPVAVGRRQFRLTPTGTVAVEIESDYRAASNRLRESASLLNSLPADAPISRAFVADAEVYRSARTPDIALQPGTELLAGADKMMGTATVVRQDYFENLQARVEAGGFELEIVVGPDLLAAIVSNHRDEFARLSAHDAVTMYTTEKPLPYALWITEGEQRTAAGITVHEDGGVKGTIVNESAPAVAWAKDQYARYREAATTLAQQPDRRPDD